MATSSSVGVLRKVLNNGLRVIIEPLSDFSSISVGLWILTGSRDEDPNLVGISHLIEHLAFKGTPSRSAKQIALEIDSLGGVLNAFTSKEFTSFYAKVLGDSLPHALSILSDTTMNSLFRGEDINKEREIILQEISMVEDAPEDFVHDLHTREFWSGHSLGRPILGTSDSLKAITRKSILSYHQERYCPGSMIITAAGALDPDKLFAELERSYGGLAQGSSPEIRKAPEPTPRIRVVNRDLEQVHFCTGFESIAVGDERRYALFLMNTILGAGMSSRLFQKIREEHGLAYSVYSYPSAYQDTGMLTIYCGTSIDGFPTALDLVRQESKKLRENPVSAVELDVAKRQLKGNLLLGLESTSNRMSQLARNEIYYGRHIAPEQIVEGIDKVTAGDISELAATIINPDRMALTVIGPVNEDELNAGLA